MNDLDKRYCPFFYDFREVDPDRFDIVLPLDIASQRFLNAHPHLKIHRKGLLASDAVIDLCNDKLALNRFLISKGFGSYIPKVDSDFSFPYVLKKRIDNWGINSFVIRNKADESRHAEALASEAYFRQEYVGGLHEYSSYIIVKNRRIVFLKSLKFTFAEPYLIHGKYGRLSHVELVDHDHLRTDFERILNILDYKGLCTIDYKITQDGIKLFEINPRCGGRTNQFINSILEFYE